MNRKQLLILIIVGAILAGAGYMVYQQNKASWQSGGDQMGRELLQDFPLNDVARIRIASGDQEVNLVRQEDQWQVEERYGYPAKFSQISSFLRTIWELEGVQQLTVGESQLGRLELALPGEAPADAGTLVEFKDSEGEPIRSMVLGKQHMGKSNRPSPYGGGQGFPDGRYLMVLEDGQPSRNAWLVSEPFSNISPDPGQWLNKDFLQIKKLRSVTVSPGKEGEGWTLTRETEGGDWKISDLPEDKELDSSKTSRVNNAFSYGSFADVASPDLSPEETGFNQPVVARLETFDDFQYTLQIGKQNDEGNYFVTVDVQADIPAEKELPEETGGDSASSEAGSSESNSDEGEAAAEAGSQSTEAKAKEIEAFNENVRTLKEKLEKEQAYQNWTYLISERTVEPFLNQRQDLLTEPEEQEPTSSESTSTSPGATEGPSLPGSDIFPPEEIPEETPVPLAPEDEEPTEKPEVGQEPSDSEPEPAESGTSEAQSDNSDSEQSQN